MSDGWRGRVGGEEIGALTMLETDDLLVRTGMCDGVCA